MVRQQAEGQRRAQRHPAAQALAQAERVQRDERQQEDGERVDAVREGVEVEELVEQEVRDLAERAPVEVGVLEQEDVAGVVPEVVRLELGEGYEVVAVEAVVQRRNVDDGDGGEDEQQQPVRPRPTALAACRINRAVR